MINLDFLNWNRTDFIVFFIGIYGFVIVWAASFINPINPISVSVWRFYGFINYFGGAFIVLCFFYFLFLKYFRGFEKWCQKFS